MSGSQSVAGPLIYGVPLALWIAVGVALLSAIVTLTSVVLSNRNSRKNLREQLRRSAEEFAAQLAHDSAQLERRLAHEAEQRDRERAMSLRREVYLEAAAALNHVNATVGRLADISNDPKTIWEAFATDLAKIAKVHIMGSAETIGAVMDYVNVIGPAFSELVEKRMPLAIRQAAINLESTFMDTALAERKRFTAMMQQLNLEGVRDAAKWDPIKRQSDLAADTYRSHAETRQVLWNEQVKDTLALAARSIAVAEQAIPLLPPAILAVRKEMDAPLDPEWYASLWDRQLANVKRVTARLLESLRDSHEKQSAEAAPNIPPPAAPSGQ
jgi:heme exporter protein D